MEKSIEEVVKRNVDISYELHYTKQMLMKILAHIIAYNGRMSAPVEEIIKEFLDELNEHHAKVHFTQDELNDIKSVIEESKKFI